VHAVPSDLTEDDLKVTATVKEGASVTEEALFRWCIDQLPYFALPRYIELRAELPRSPVGRVLKRELRSEGVTASTWDAEAAGVTYENVTKVYGGSSEAAVQGLSLEVSPGEICVLVGPSGCGKTTAMRMVNRTVEITEGDITIGEVSVRDREPAELRRQIGYVIQQVGLFPHRTIAENIGTVPSLVGWDGERIASTVTELLELIGLDPEMRDRYPAQLSGGQQQRVGVARALAADPPVMLMDEPFGAIDPISRERLQNQFLRLQAEIRKTVLFVTHDIDEAIKMGDRIAIMKKGGHLAQFATPAELLMAPADDFVEDFVGADRALKRLALLRVSDIDLWEAPLAHVGQATGEVRAKLEGAEVPHALLVDSERRPLGWLSERDLAQETVPAKPDSSADPILDRNDVLRDALADLLRAGNLYAPVVDGERKIAGVLSVDVISEYLSSPKAAVEEHPAVERPQGED
jgi:osmoprotectant transport system ATP-binding protein